MTSNDEGSRAALYCRVSTEDQAKEGYSLTAQRERLEAYCLAKGWKVSRVYVDDGYSGRKAERPAYRRMMEERDQWDILVVMKMDRIHRNSKNFTLMMEKLYENNKEFTSMQESFDTTNAMGRFVMDIIQRIAQLESEQIGERVYTGMKQKAKQGRGILGFNAPFGFDFKNDLLVINDEESQIVKGIFRSYANGSTLREICRDLESKSLRTKKGSHRWDPKTVQRILSNPIHCGFLKWDGIIYRSEVRPLISEDLFKEVQIRLHGRSPHLITIPKKEMEKEAAS